MTANPRQTVGSTAQVRYHTLLANAEQVLEDHTASLDDLRQLAECSEQARLLAQKSRMGLGPRNRAAEIKLRAERRAGALLASMTLSRGGRPAKHQRALPETRLADLGIDKSRSSRWKILARIPEEDFQAFLDDVTRGSRELTQRAALQLGREIGGRADRSHPRNSPSPACPSPMPRTHPALVEELRNHCSQLLVMLSPIRDLSEAHQATQLRLEPPQRRYVARLLQEIGDLLEAMDQSPA